MSGADRPPLDAEELLRRITRRGVDFVVVGGIAAVLHGSARATFDLDIAFAADDANLHALGYNILRFTNQQILESPESVLSEIARFAQASFPSGTS